MGLYGISFPWRKGDDGIPSADYDRNVVKGSIIQIIKTRMGERIREPTYGSLIYRLLFDNNNELTIVKIKEEVYRAISAWEKRVDILKIDVVIDESTITIDVFYEYLNEADDVKIEIDKIVV